MAVLPDHLTPKKWLAQVFSSAEAQRGGVVKRKVRDVERLVGREAFLREASWRGFQVLQNNQHFVVFCNGLPIRHCR
ncbi:N-(5'-phosphoribosyl)anthranilate isomerase [Ruegeria marisrubri]|uniref:N-(5'-phosphoribosyl)anthranilate isomerase n=2 Tax=Ruegeria marisrubri TaxID=1685379 RepID=A0A0X3TXJ6_9RHOB|nr:N-(5'-phosphoribosyl)anthranilate isomerase [Ruegeria marisrubri]KUJ80382.1 N-(5'-phosphoribosyl)anthranilate isomerase [Ruegeria marisrubri]